MPAVHRDILLIGLVLSAGLRTAVCAGADPQPDLAALQSVNGSVFSGRVSALDSERVVLDAGDAGEMTLPTRDVLIVRFAPVRNASDAPPAWVLFPNGDRASLEVLRMEEESLICRWRSFPAWEPLRIPLETISGLIAQPLDSRDARRELIRELSRGRFAADVLVLSNRDRLSGELRNVTTGQYELNTPVGPVQAAAPQVLAVALDSSLVSLPGPEGDSVVATLTDGSWLTLIDVRREASGEFAATTLFGAPVSFPRSAVAALTFCGPRVTLVSTLNPASSQTQPYLSSALNSTVLPNRNVRGGFLALRGREFPRGIGVTSASRTVYELGGAYRYFLATIGIDDEADGGGSAAFGVEVDGRRVFASPVLTGRSAPVDVGPLDVKGAHELALIVEYGEYGDMLDYADWGDAVLVRPSAP